MLFANCSANEGGTAFPICLAMIESDFPKKEYEILNVCNKAPSNKEIALF